MYLLVKPTENTTEYSNVIDYITEYLGYEKNSIMVGIKVDDNEETITTLAELNLGAIEYAEKIVLTYKVVIATSFDDSIKVDIMSIKYSK